jgi:hypothetical protein
MDLKRLWQTTIEYTLFLVVGFIVLFQDLGFQGIKRKLTRSEDPVRLRHRFAFCIFFWNFCVIPLVFGIKWCEILII